MSLETESLEQGDGRMPELAEFRGGDCVHLLRFDDTGNVFCETCGLEWVERDYLIESQARQENVLDSILENQKRMADAMNSVQEVVTAVGEQAKPMLDMLKDSPVLGMLGIG